MYKKLPISVVMIVKDEAGIIQNALNSVLPFASQIIVADTGSSDETPSICSRLGAEVYFRKWDNNFSNARNFAISHARYPWILSIDADEIIDIDSLFANLEYFEDESIGGLNIRIVNALGEDDGSPQWEHRYTRLFRKSKDIRYEGRIHEQIRVSIENIGLRIIETDIKIKHFGYTDIDDDKKVRNKTLLEEELKSNPNDSWVKLHLAETEFTMQNFDAAFELLLPIYEAIDLSQDQKTKARIRLGQICLAQDRFHEMYKFLSFETENLHLEGLRKFILAAGYLYEKRYSDALKLYLSAEVQNSLLVDKNRLAEAVNALKQIPGI